MGYKTKFNCSVCNYQVEIDVPFSPDEPLYEEMEKQKVCLEHFKGNLDDYTIKNP